MNKTNQLLEFLEGTLASRSQRGLLRTLQFDEPKPPSSSETVDFSSNDYLGLSRSKILAKKISEEYTKFIKHSRTFVGSTGSRLLSGDSHLATDIEAWIANFHEAESSLLFNSGFDANSSLLSCLPPPNSVVLYDELVHNSCHDGIRNSRAQKKVSWKHNDLQDLENYLQNYIDLIKIIVIESVYSMDGHTSPLPQICDLADKYNAQVIVDEAHGTGFYGDRGQGLCQYLRQHNRVFARVHTFGKALGCHGAAVIGPKTLKSFLVNYARPLIYSTSLPVHSLISIQCAYELMSRQAQVKQRRLRTLIERFRSKCKESNICILDSKSPI